MVYQHLSGFPGNPGFSGFPNPHINNNQLISYMKSEVIFWVKAHSGPPFYKH